MKRNKIYICILVAVVLLGGILVYNKSEISNDIGTDTQIENKDSSTQTKMNEGLLFLKEIAGVKATEVELIDEPIGFSGKFIAPRESILKGIDFFLKDTQNDKMKDIEIDIGNGYIDLEATYEVNSFISTPVEVKVKPSLDIDKNLVLEVYELRFLDLSIPKWIVNLGVEGFVKDWFPEGESFDVMFDKGKVVIDKSNFEVIMLQGLSVDSKGIKVDMIVNLEKIL